MIIIIQQHKKVLKRKGLVLDYRICKPTETVLKTVSRQTAKMICTYPFTVIEQKSTGLQCSKVEASFKVVEG